MGRNFCLSHDTRPLRAWVLSTVPWMYSIRQGYGGELIEGQTDRNHIYLLISLPLSQDLTTVVRSLKTQLSKEVYAHPVYDRIVKQHLFGDVPLWSPSYFAAPTGSVSLDTVRAYIKDQRSDEHKRKYEKRSRYWNS